ncbi:B12-binding domain-containing radical SAM protein [Chloroflexota bacterium]
MVTEALKIALVNPSQNARYPQPPMGLGLIAAVLEREGYTVTLLDANALRLSPEEVVPYVSDADVVGLSAMTPTIGSAMSIAHYLKRANPGLTVIVGGAHVTLLPEETLASAPQVDIVVRGEGEETFVDLLRTLENEQPLEDVPGISYRKDGKIASTPERSTSVDLDSLPFLAYHLLPWQKYKPHPPHGRALPFAAIITSRGCPYKCSFCSKVFGNKFRGQSPERVVDEIAYYKENFGVKEIAFYDDIFTLDKKRAYAIADNIIKRDLKIDWTCEARVNLVDRELLHHMKQAGCYAVAYGIESASPVILDVLGKGITPAQVEEAVRITREVGMQTVGYFMIGSPGESTDTISKTIEFAKRLKIDFAQFAITTPFPGSELYNLYLEGGRGSVSWDDFIYWKAGAPVSPVFESEGLSRHDLQRWVKRAYREFYLRPAYLWQRLQRVTSWGDLKVNIKGLLMLLGNLGLVRRNGG